MQQAPLGRLGTPHDLRDTHIMRLADNGVPLHVASRIAGHADIKITEKFYLQASTEDDDRILAALAGSQAQPRLSAEGAA